MREPAGAERIRRLMQGLGRACPDEVRVYFTGGATAVLLGWRETTIDTDLCVVPESDALLRALPALKEELDINIELASPADFIPELPGWQDRSPFIARHGHVAFHHYDPYAQTLAKIERGHAQDEEDVRSFFRSELVEPARLRELFGQIEPRLYRYPALDPTAFRRAVEAAVARPSPGASGGN